MYKKLFKENSLSILNNVELVPKIFEFILKNPYPVDDQVHQFAQSIGMEADNLEIYIYAMLSAFICGGKSANPKKPFNEYSDKEKAMGIKVEYEHVDEKNENPVVKKICDLFSKKIAYDHLTDNEIYYETGMKVNLFDELIKGE